MPMTSGVTCSQIISPAKGVLRKVTVVLACERSRARFVVKMLSAARAALHRTNHLTIPAFLVSVGTVQYINVRDRVGLG